MRVTLILVCALATAGGGVTAQNATTLQLVQVLYRHGARTPIYSYPNDTNADHWWQGPGQLTNEGKNNQYELGAYLRRRYAGFLSPLYHTNHTQVESSDVDRTLMSAQVNLAALYPPQGRDKWNPDLAWQPIPVHTRPSTDDYKLRFIDACERYRQARKELDSSEYVRKVDRKYAPLYEYLHSVGVMLNDVESLSELYDTLWIDDRHGLAIPEWARRRLPAFNRTVYPELLRPISDLAFQLFSHTAEMRRLGGGVLLADMTEHMAAAAAGSLQPLGRQLFMYSAHDFTVAALLGALDVYNGIAPPLASCVIVELHRDASGAFFVELFYRNDTTVQPYRLRLPNCTDRCPWEAFRNLTAAVRPADAAAECAVSPPPTPAPPSPPALIVAAVLVCGLLLVLLVAALVLYCRRRRDEQFHYSALSTN
ncbi:Lysosomal acid phosphatase [Amphibalanus amphitrite]|uniref:acid phosphatase n=1 Tax=Amphibalanus amphitrite TaxID=1232801 RepID=A0A6A4W5J6_AMPAM|nr:Lysosomal acid phosphatase [Amphibalanus amphitrite]